MTPMLYHVVRHTLDVAIVDAPSPAEAVKAAEKDKTAFKTLSEDYIVREQQTKDLN